MTNYHEKTVTETAQNENEKSNFDHHMSLAKEFGITRTSRESTKINLADLEQKIFCREIQEKRSICDVLFDLAKCRAGIMINHQLKFLIIQNV